MASRMLEGGEDARLIDRKKRAGLMRTVEQLTRGNRSC